MPFSTLPPRSASFQLLRTTGGIHRPVIEGLLPSTVYISVYPHQNAKIETNMFRHASSARSAKAVPSPETIFLRFCPGQILSPNSAKAREVIR
jgi:hypothetical protein